MKKARMQEESTDEETDVEADEEESETVEDDEAPEEIDVMRLIQSDLGNIEMSGMALVLFRW